MNPFYKLGHEQALIDAGIKEADFASDAKKKIKGAGKAVTNTLNKGIDKVNAGVKKVQKSDTWQNLKKNAF